MITYSPNQGWSFAGVNGSRSFCCADSSRPGFFSEGVEHSLNGLIASRFKEMNI